MDLFWVYCSQTLMSLNHYFLGQDKIGPWCLNGPEGPHSPFFPKPIKVPRCILACIGQNGLWGLYGSLDPTAHFVLINKGPTK